MKKPRKKSDDFVPNSNDLEEKYGWLEEDFEGNGKGRPEVLCHEVRYSQGLHGFSNSNRP